MIQSDRYDTTASGNLVARADTAFDDLGRVYQKLRLRGRSGHGILGTPWPTIPGTTWPATHQAAAGRLAGLHQDLLRRRGPAHRHVPGLRPGRNVLGPGRRGGRRHDRRANRDVFDAAGNVIFNTTLRRLKPRGDRPVAAARPASQTSARAATGRLVRRHRPPRGHRRLRHRGDSPAWMRARPAARSPSSATLLVAAAAYNDRGERYSTTDPAGRASQTQFDDAGRVVAQVQNVVMARCHCRRRVRPERDGAPTATRPTESSRRSPRSTASPATRSRSISTALRSPIPSWPASTLLRAEIYPDSDNTADPLGNGPSGVYNRIEYAYNRQGQVVSKKDQNATVHEYVYDGLGRLTQDCVTAAATGVDTAVLSMAASYEVRGLPQNLTSYDNAAPNSGNIVNDVQLVYNDFGQLTADYQ